ncbi:hypothetical protein MTR67_024117 [Solanum verrucosum]|uniref:Hydrophobic seed protein domain-containing protein n=1 Tax=Solanum verrucosum TaxID=315347 RepID=A0AAF0QUS8_SOLVR|nr:hypothetical protein MTR67_024117 [Solanum verrucosum]
MLCSALIDIYEKLSPLQKKAERDQKNIEDQSSRSPSPCPSLRRSKKANVTIDSSSDTEPSHAGGMLIGTKSGSLGTPLLRYIKYRKQNLSDHDNNIGDKKMIFVFLRDISVWKLNVVIGSPPVSPCCSHISGLADIEAALCLCTAIKANVLRINLNVLSH